MVTMPVDLAWLYVSIEMLSVVNLVSCLWYVDPLQKKVYK